MVILIPEDYRELQGPGGHKMRFHAGYLSFIVLMVITIACAASVQNRSEASRPASGDNSRPASDEPMDMAVEVDASETPATDEELAEMNSLGYVQGDMDSESEPEGELEGDEAENEEEVIGRLLPSVSTSDAGDSSPDDELIPDGWPEYVPIMEGFKVNIGSQSRSVLTLVAFGEQPLDDVKEFYLNLPEWELTEDPRIIERSEDDDTISDEEIYIFSRGYEMLMFKVYENEEQTVINLMYEDQTPDE